MTGSREERVHHLGVFLFYEPHQIIATLSGGEKARLSLAVLAASPPRLFLIDEITNNLDLETKTHVAEILKLYPGSMIVISHETEFLQTLGMTQVYPLTQGRVTSEFLDPL